MKKIEAFKIALTDLKYQLGRAYNLVMPPSWLCLTSSHNFVRTGTQSPVMEELAIAGCC
jgi:hypothetical protein